VLILKLTIVSTQAIKFKIRYSIVTLQTTMKGMWKNGNFLESAQAIESVLRLTLIQNLFYIIRIFFNCFVSIDSFDWSKYWLKITSKILIYINIFYRALVLICLFLCIKQIFQLIKVWFNYTYAILSVIFWTWQKNFIFIIFSRLN
jgi:hypothetical protein